MRGSISNPEDDRITNIDKYTFYIALCSKVRNADGGQQRDKRQAALAFLSSIAL